MNMELYLAASGFTHRIKNVLFPSVRRDVHGQPMAEQPVRPNEDTLRKAVAIVDSLRPSNANRIDWLDSIYFDPSSAEERAEMTRIAVELRRRSEPLCTWLVYACQFMEGLGEEIPEDWVDDLRAAVRLAAKVDLENYKPPFLKDCLEWLECREKGSKARIYDPHYLDDWKKSQEVLPRSERD